MRVSLADKRDVVFIFIVFLASLFLLGFFSYGVLQDFPNSADEYEYLFQAQTFLKGRLWNPPPPVGEFFTFWHFINRDGKWLAKCPPGWPLVLAFGRLLRIPFGLIDPLAGTLSLLVLFAIGNRLYGFQPAVISVLSVLFSPFFIFNSASYFSHAPCSFFILLYVYFLIRFTQNVGKKNAMAAGFFIGLAFTTRYYTAILCAVPCLGFLLNRKYFKGLLWVFLGALPVLIVNLIYNGKITGNIFLTPFSWYDPSDRLGFIEKFYHWEKTLQQMNRSLSLFLSWTNPVFLYLYPVRLIYALIKRNIQGTDFVFLFLAAGHLFYWGAGGNQYGPRYYYEAYPFLVLSVCSFLFSGSRVGKFNLLKKIGIFVFFLGFIAVLWKIPSVAEVERRVIFQRTDIYRQIKEKGIERAVVFIRSGTGPTRYMEPRDLTRNDPDLKNSVLYVLDKGRKNRELKAYFPDRDFYVYWRKPDQARGQLERLNF